MPVHRLSLKAVKRRLKPWLYQWWRVAVQEGRTNAVAYGMSLGAVGLATLLRIILDPVLGEHHAFTLYFASVAIAAWYGGLGPALVATLTSYFAADWFFITPRFEINLPHENLDEFLALIAFVFSCLAIAITSAIMRRALARAREKQRELENEIVERQRAEQALHEAQLQLRQYAGELEHRVQERTAHLHETIRSLEGVCYHLAHDLRAPLRAMEGFTSILLKEYIDRLDPDGTAYLQSISKASTRMELLIQGLMEYGRMGHGDFPLRRVNPRRALQSVLTRMAVEISAKHARVELGQDWPEVLGNEDLLEVVFGHLLQNSLKFAQRGITPQIRICAETENDSEAPTGRFDHLTSKGVRFVVEDNGVGMPAELISRAFWIFERLHPRENYPGTGIGLAIVSKAVERMDGRVGANSEENVGSTFWFELPAVNSETSGPALEKSPARAARPNPLGALRQ